MANIGDVTVTLRAKVDEFTRPMKEATAQLNAVGPASKNVAASLASLKDDVALMTADFRSGRLGAREYAASMAATRQQVLALGASMHQADAGGVRQFNALLAATAPAAEKTRVTLQALRSPIATIASQAVGASGSVGQLGSILLSLGLGGGVAIAALAGLAAIAKAMDVLTEGTRATQKAYDDYMASLRKNTDLSIVGAQLDNAREKLKKLQTVVGGGRAGGLHTLGTPSEIAAQTAIVKGLADQYQQLFQGLAHGDEHLSTIAEAGQKAADAFEAARKAALGTAEAIRYAQTVASGGILAGHRPADVIATPSIPLINQGANALNNLSNPTGNLFRETFGNGLSSGINGVMLDGVKRALAIVSRAAEIQEQGRRIGESIGNALSRGIVDTLFGRVKSLGDALKEIFAQILQAVLKSVIQPFADKFGQIIARALHGGGGNGGGTSVVDLIGTAIGIGGFFGLARQGDTSGATLVVPVSRIPANPSPIAMARDAQHQALWMETARVANQMGFRLVPA